MTIVRKNLAAAFAMLCLANVVPLVRAQGLPAAPSVRVRTASGEVIGMQASGLLAFRSLPYAQPPIGKLRFRRALPVKSWSTARPAIAAGPACYQVLDLDDPAEDGDRVMSEDCLTLNVWTPGTAPARRPVMVFIHGGGFEEGSAANSWYDGSTLARSGDVVVVTLQYRLGSLGFLELSGLGGAAWLGSGNNGLTDQIEALRWIRQNIAAFGGDPANVTIFGESAGGASVRALMGVPEARELFHKAIVESGTGHFVTKARAAQIGQEFAKLAGARNVADLQRLSPEAVMAAQAAFFSVGYGSMPFGIVEDGVLFRKSPLQSLAADASLSKPLLIGTNAEEMRYWTALDANGIDRQPDGPLRERVRAVFGPEIGDPLGIYQQQSESTEEAIITLIGDAVFRMPSIRLAEINATRQPTYMYLFTYRSLTHGQTGLEYGAMHGLEVAFVFQVDTAQGYSYVGPRDSWRHLSNQMIQAWTNFARTGDPNGPLLPIWPTYDVSSRATMAFGRHSDTVLDPYGAERRAWDRVPSDRLDSIAALGLTDIATPNDK